MINKVENLIFTDDIDSIKQDTLSRENRFCLIFCTSGSLQLVRGNEAFVIKEEDMVIWHADILVGHYMRTPDFKGYLLSIDDRMVKELLMEVCRIEPRWWEIMRSLRSNPVLSFQDEQYRRLLKAYFDLLKLYIEGEQTEYRKRTYMLLAKAASYEVLAGMDRNISADDIGDSATAADRLMRNFIEMLRNDDGTHREVAWYADRMNITPKYLSSICKQKVKMTASAVIQQVTCEHIKHYLLDTDMNIKEIAYRLKFPTISFFCKYVRQHLNASPMELRRNGGLN